MCAHWQALMADTGSKTSFIRARKTRLVRPIQGTALTPTWTLSMATPARAFTVRKRALKRALLLLLLLLLLFELGSTAGREA
jgi:inner membrane protein involved in colicin E2 resistance